MVMSDTVEITFDERHVEAIQHGIKRVTFRYDFDEAVEPGDTVELVTPDGTFIDRATIVETFTLEARAAARAGFSGHRRYATCADLLDELAEYYPGAEIGPVTELTVLVFTTGGDDA